MSKLDQARRTKAALEKMLPHLRYVDEEHECDEQLANDIVKIMDKLRNIILHECVK